MKEFLVLLVLCIFQMHGISEMLRVPLDNLVLQISSMSLNEPCIKILTKCPDPPDITAVDNAISSLKCTFRVYVFVYVVFYDSYLF